MGIETSVYVGGSGTINNRLNGLGSPMGIETAIAPAYLRQLAAAKWPGKPDGD